MVQAAREVSLSLEEELSEVGAVLLLTGEVAISASVSDVAAARVQAPALLPCWSTSSEAPALKLTSLGTTRLAAWPRTELAALLESCPWVIEELDRRADRYASLAGATMGPLADLDDGARDIVFDRLEPKTLAPGEAWLAPGSELGGLAIVAVGEVIVGDEGAVRALGSGELVFPAEVLEGRPCAEKVVAGANGATVLVASKAATRELFSTVPSLLELLRVD